MAELRRDPRTGAWSLISAERRRRPTHVGGEPGGGPCALCPGVGEPLELAHGAHGVRVVAHGRPGLRVERQWRAPQGDRAPAVGAHEVLIEGHAHAWSGWAGRRAVRQEHLVQRQARCADLSHDTRLRTFVWVRDHDTGLSPRGVHPHGQLFGLPVPVAPHSPLTEHPRLQVCEAGTARAVVAPAPRGDFALEIAPGSDVADTAQVLWRVLVALDVALAAPPVSCAWSSASHGLPGLIQVRPWLASPSALDLVDFGFATWGPEEAAALLRDALP